MSRGEDWRAELDPTPHLGTRALGRKLELWDEIGSTNDRAKELGASGGEHGTLVLARAQTRGRGRNGRRWASPAQGGIYASFLVRPSLALSASPLLTLSAAVAVQAAVARSAGVSALIKWPNDLLAPSGPQHGKKLGGLLVESSSRFERLAFAVIGVGLNAREVERGPELAASATSFEALGAGSATPAVIVAEIASALETVLDRLSRGESQGILSDWAQHAFGMGQPATVIEAERETRGVMRGIAEDGALLLELQAEAGPKLRRIYSGDFWPLGVPRPAPLRAR